MPTQGDTAPPATTHARVPYIVLLVAGITVFFVALGSGIGVGFGISESIQSKSSPATFAASPGTAITSANKLLAYNGSAGVATTSALDDQWGIILPALTPLARILAAYVDGNASNFQLTPQVIRYFVTQEFGSGDVVSNLFTMAQQLQANPSFFQTITQATDSIVDIFTSLKGNLLGGSGRKLNSLSDDAMKQLLTSILGSSGGNGTLNSVFDPSVVSDMLVGIYNFAKVMIDNYEAVKYRQQNMWHADKPDFSPLATPFTDVRGRGIQDGGGYNISAIPLFPTKGQIIDIVPTSRRSLLQTNMATSSSMQLTNIPISPNGNYPGPQQPSVLPPLRIPIIFHVTLYADPNPTGYGPPNWNFAAASCANLIKNLNIMGAPAQLSFWVQECRADPVAYPYLVIPGGQAGYDICMQGDNYFSDQCGSPLIPNSIANYPRAINVYVNGRPGQASFAGYSTSPLATNSALNGHIWIAMSVFDSVGGTNNEINFQDGSQMLMHEVGHALGLAHTFYEGGDVDAAMDNCIDADGITDTPTTNGAVSSIPFGGVRPQNWCTREINRAPLSNLFPNIYARQSSGLGIRPTEQTLKVQSCAATSSRTPYVANTAGDELGNYMSYTYTSCLAAFGHFTLGQVQAMHASLTYFNPNYGISGTPSTNNSIMYQWGQYYASLPLSQLPTGYASYNVANPLPPNNPPSAPSPHPTPCPLAKPAHQSTSPDPVPPLSCHTFSPGASPGLSSSPGPSSTAPHTPSAPAHPPKAKKAPPPSKVKGRRLASAMAPPPTVATVPAPARDVGCTETQHNCTCSQNWYYEDPMATANATGVWYSGCANLGSAGAWCAIDKVVGCSSGVRNGWWDYCQAPSCAAVVTGPPTYTPPAGIVLPPLPANTCNAGGVTVSGARCSADPWQAVDYDRSGVVHSGCANPDNDPQGEWCDLVHGTTSVTGQSWDYCQPICTPNLAALATCTTSALYVPTGCTCANDWAFAASDGTTMTNVHGCTSMILGNNAVTACQLVCPAGSANAALDGSFNIGCECN
ncbi:MAG: hypothetical protein WDW36_010252 [Sanguina aurantia]